MMQTVPRHLLELVMRQNFLLYIVSILVIGSLLALFVMARMEAPLLARAAGVLAFFIGVGILIFKKKRLGYTTRER
jgi:protein-S-isoprenylcysteine O-methyltransferase Ste14